MLKLTIAIPNYNGGENLKNAIQSCKYVNLSQENFEILVVDNKSEDNSVQIINELKDKFQNLRININEVNVGRIQNWNICVEKALGKYLIFLFANDTISKENNIAEIIDKLDADDSISLSMSPLIRKEKHREFVKKKFSTKQIKCLATNFVKNCLRRGLLPFGPIQAIIYRTDDIKKTNNHFLENFPINADEIFTYIQATVRKFILFNTQPQVVWDLTKSRFHGKMTFENEFNEHAKTIEEINKCLHYQLDHGLISTYRFINLLKYTLNPLHQNDGKIRPFLKLISNMKKNDSFFSSDALLIKTLFKKLKNSYFDADDILYGLIINLCLKEANHTVKKGVKD